MARILLADDVPLMVEAVVTALESEGHQVAVAADGDAAMLLLTSEKFDIAVLDIWMPKKSGLDVLKALRQLKPDMPVILISGGGTGATLEQATAIADIYRADRVLYKPFEDEELLSAIAQLVK
jgi:two-component system, chemotaxis family, chemotaxis protein CheY